MDDTDEYNYLFKGTEYIIFFLVMYVIDTSKYLKPFNLFYYYYCLYCYFFRQINFHENVVVFFKYNLKADLTVCNENFFLEKRTISNCQRESD